MATSGKKNKKRSKILVADISHTVRRLIAQFLQDDYDVIEAESAAEIMQKLEKYHDCDSHCIDKKDTVPKITAGCDPKELAMIIMSLEFSDSNAFKIAMDIRKKFHAKCLPIIISTSTNHQQTILKALQCGINDFIVKPFPKELLISKIHKLEHEIPIQDLELSELIAKIPFFSGVPEGQVAYVLNTCAETITHKKGDVLCEQGGDDYDLFILLEGQCDVLYYDKKVAEIHAVDTIGEMGFIANQERSATVVAAADAKVITINHDRFDQYLNEERAISERICKNIILSLNDRIKKSNEMVKKLKILAEEYLKF